jgi:hypothetical protein
MNDNTSNTTAPLSDRTILVHKQDSEGSLIINALSGMVQQTLDERPEWSEGLTCALLAERHLFYSSRLGPEYAAEHSAPTAIAFEDLGWIAVDAEGEPVELEADAEWRMNVIADATGTIRSDDLSRTRQDDTKGELAHALLDMDAHRTAAEVPALEKAQHEGFAAKTGTDNGHNNN